MPKNTVKVAIPGKWGNPFLVAEHGREGAVQKYRDLIELLLRLGEIDMSELRGKNLAFWCQPGEPCHADILLEIANRVGDP